MPAIPDHTPAPRSSIAPRPVRTGRLPLLSVRWLTTLAAPASFLLIVSNLTVWHTFTTRWFAANIEHGSLNLLEADRDNPPTERTIDVGWVWLSELPGYELKDRIAYFQWLPRAGSLPTLGGTQRQWYLELPLWIPLLICTPLSILAWRAHIHRRRQAAIRCPNCNYDLAGLPAAATCPECGR